MLERRNGRIIYMFDTLADLKEWVRTHSRRKGDLYTFRRDAIVQGTVSGLTITSGVLNSFISGTSSNMFKQADVQPKEQTVEDTLNGQIRELNRRIQELVEVKYRLSSAVLASPVSTIREAAKHL